MSNNGPVSGAGGRPPNRPVATERLGDRPPSAADGGVGGEFDALFEAARDSSAEGGAKPELSSTLRRRGAFGGQPGGSSGGPFGQGGKGSGAGVPTALPGLTPSLQGSNQAPTSLPPAKVFAGGTPIAGSTSLPTAGASPPPGTPAPGTAGGSTSLGSTPTLQSTSPVFATGGPANRLASDPGPRAPAGGSLINVGVPSGLAAGPGTALSADVATALPGNTVGATVLASQLGPPEKAGTTERGSTETATLGGPKRRRIGEDDEAALAAGAQGGEGAGGLSGRVAASDSPTATHTPLPIPAIVDKLVEAMSVRSTGETSTVELRLDLGPLGGAEVAVERNADGAIEVHFAVPDPQAAGEIARAARELVASLAERGLDVARVAITSGDGNVSELAIERPNGGEQGNLDQEGQPQGGGQGQQHGQDERSRGRFFTAPEKGAAND